MAQGGGVSGKKTVLAIFGVAVLLCAILFYTGLREKRRRALPSPAPADTSVAVPVRETLDSLPREWTRITFIEGQGWVVFVPCEGQPGSLKVDLDSAGGRLQCEFCDTLSEAQVAAARRTSASGRLDLDLGSLGMATMEPVTDVVAARFQDAPVRGFVLTWHPPDSGPPLFFVPADLAGEFETLRAEDESPEGCGGGEPPGGEGTP